MDLFKYFKRFTQLFFTKPTLVKTENGRNRGWICEAMRRFAEFYDYQYQNPELKLIVREIIERYEINKKMRRKDILWIAEENYLDNTIKTVLSAFTTGDLAIVVRFALFSGLRGKRCCMFMRSRFVRDWPHATVKTCIDKQAQRIQHSCSK